MTDRILITGARAPAAVELAILFSGMNAEVHVADSTPLTLAGGLTCIAASHRVPPARDNPRLYGSAVESLVARLNVDLVVPTCEEIFFLAAARDSGRRIPLLAPPLAKLRTLHDKFAFIDFARQAGVPVPETEKITSAEKISAFREPGHFLALKPCFSRFGTETLLRSRWSDLSRLKLSPEAPWIAQEFLEGGEICSYAVGHRGTLVAFAAYRPLHRMGKAASYYFEPLESPEAEAIAARIVDASGFHGQIAFDMIETRDRGLLPIECNPRATSGVHLFAGQPDLARRMLHGSPDGSVLRPLPGMAPPMVASAMWLFGLPRALGGGLGCWRRDLKRGRDVLSVPGGSLNNRAWWVFGSYCLEALKTRRSLRTIATSDIEWNGEALDAGV